MSRSARTRIALGIYQDAYGYSVMASIGSGTRRLNAPEIRYPRGTALDIMKARWEIEKQKLKQQQQATRAPRPEPHGIGERLVLALERIADQLEKRTT